MAKKINTDSLIGVELDKLESKVKEFQKYLEINNILTMRGTVRFDEVEEDLQDKLHKEMIIQIKVQDAIFNWLPLLEKLREDKKTKALETRGDVAINGMFKKRQANAE